MKKILILLSLLALPGTGFSLDLNGHWVLEKSEITYTVTHPLHVVHGKSISAKGKGVCYSGHGDFHLGVLVKSFDSGDGNRDLHMLEVTRAGLYPLIDVKAKLADIGGKKAPQELTADVTIQFAGKTKEYPKIKLEVIEWKEGTARITGIIPLTLKDFDIEPPSLLTMPVKNEVPVKLDTSWHRETTKAEGNKK